jgi:glycosyltransferase involved in cell wall biosynthesis
MTKNGRDRLPALLKSVVGFCDLAVVLDTGSTDGTQEFLKKQTTLPVRLHEAPFVDFGTSRSLGMSLAKDSADWLVLLDDDMSLQFTDTPEEVKDRLSEQLSPCYLLRVDQNTTYWNTRVVSGHQDWHYIGVTHEYLDRSIGALKLEGVTIKHDYNHGPGKFERDARLLSADIARDPDNPRTIFYLAQTFRDQGRLLAAIRYYELRARMGGWDEEVYFSMYESSRLARDPKAMQQAFEYRPSRAEPAAWLRDYYQSQGQPELAARWEETRKKLPLPNDILFVSVSCYG